MYRLMLMLVVAVCSFVYVALLAGCDGEPKASGPKTLSYWNALRGEIAAVKSRPGLPQFQSAVEGGQESARRGCGSGAGGLRPAIRI